VNTTLEPAVGGTAAHVASPSQREAIEAGVVSQLVLAGPGAGKTYCLTERIRFLIDHLGLDPSRICAFTFTNKAAGEIAHRLESSLGASAARVKRGTIHAFCAELLRELGSHVALDPGFGIADEEYQLSVLARIEGPRRWHRNTLTRFSAHRFRREPLLHNDAALFEQYERFLGARRLLDFDLLVIEAARLLEKPDVAPLVRSRWDAVLVDEFQDVNPVQYRVIRALAAGHKHVFAVGDDEQSIYSWAGADPAVFKSMANDFGIAKKIHLEENRRCPREVFALARKLVTVNTPIFGDRVSPKAERESPFPVVTASFETDDEEIAWIIDDLLRDRAEHGHEWGDVALLYRKHEIGDTLEGAFLNAGVPCRLAQGRALSEDPVVAYVLAALRVISSPTDVVFRDALFAALLPRPLFDEARAQAEANRHDLRRQLNHMATRLPRADENGRQIRRALTDWRNLDALSKRHTTLRSLVQELLSRRVGRTRSVLDDRRDEIMDPAGLPDVVALASRLAAARGRNGELWIERLGGVEIALKNLLSSVGCTVRVGGERPANAEKIDVDSTPSVGLALGVFKAAQLMEMDEFGAAFSTFTAIDLETTDNDIEKAEIIEIAAVRVRDGEIVEKYSSFEEIWPRFREFCGDDVIVAHNGYDFDFRILKRMAGALGERFDLCTYDTLPLARDLFPTSRKLVDLARLFDVPTGQSHRALDDTVALAKIVVALDGVKRARARTTALVNLLDHLGVALALCDEEALGDEATLFRGITRVFSLSRFSTCLEAYDRERNHDETLPTVADVIERLGGADLMARIQTDKSADERYPAAMLRLRRLIVDLPDAPLESQLRLFLERAVLSKWDGNEPERMRVNLLTLHSTKGLEFSRVYIVGVEDAQLLTASPTMGPKPEEIEEARRLLYVGMTRTKDRLVLTRVATRGGKPTRGHQFLDEMGLSPQLTTEPA
jgi:superfamily I DNA/RNA helicase